MMGAKSKKTSRSKHGTAKPRSVQSRLNVQNRTETTSSQLSSNGSEVEKVSATFHSMVPLNEFINMRQQTEEEKLESLTVALNLPSPVYKTFPSAQGCVYAQVMIGDKTYTSFPDYGQCERAARLIVTNKALINLEKETIENKPVQLPSPAVDEQLILARIVKIVNAHPHGVFTHKMENYYGPQFKERLPPDWMRIVGECPDLIRIQVASNLSIITRKCTPPLEVEEETPLKSSVSKLDLNPLECSVPGKLEKPKDTFWLIYVGLVVNTSKIWCQLVGPGYSDQLRMLEVEMNEFYQKNSQSMKATSICQGVYYSFLFNYSWFRVKCLEYDAKTEEATVVFIDQGNEETCDAKLLHNLDKQFCKLPEQGLRLSLYGLEAFTDFEVATQIVEERLQNRTLYVNVQNYDSDEDCTSVIFYDTEGSDDIDLNKVISTALIEIIMPKPDIEKLDFRLVVAYVSNVTKSGDVYIHLENENMLFLTTLLNEVIVNKLSGDLSPLDISSVDHLKLYMVKSHEDGNWYRASLKNINYTSNQVDAFLIDFGNTITANINSLVELETISEILAQIPGQAVKVHLDNAPLSSFNEETVMRLKEIAPPHLRVLAKVVNKSGINNEFPTIKLFSREISSNKLISISTVLDNSEDFSDS